MLSVQLFVLSFGLLCPTTLELVFSFGLLWLFVFCDRAKGAKILNYLQD